MVKLKFKYFLVTNKTNYLQQTISYASFVGHILVFKYAFVSYVSQILFHQVGKGAG